VAAQALAQPYDVEAALVRPLTALEAQYVPTLLDQASALIRNAAPSVDQRMAAYAADSTNLTSVSAATVSTVVAMVVKRYLVNPTGIASTTETSGPFSHSTSMALRGEKGQRGILEVTAEDLKVLFPNRKRARVGSIRLRANMAPRPVGRYGGFGDVNQMIGAIVDWAPVHGVSDLFYESLLLPLGQPNGRTEIL
jgi:hypothetical protein